MADNFIIRPTLCAKMAFSWNVKIQQSWVSASLSSGAYAGKETFVKYCNDYVTAKVSVNIS